MMTKSKNVCGSPLGAERLKRELERICASAAAEVGVVFHHLQTGIEVSLHADELFPIASTLKIPLAVHVLALVDERKLELEQAVTLQDEDIYMPTWGPICTFLRSGSILTMRDLLTLMLMDSDNNATDILYRFAGGPSAVRGRMHACGLQHIHNDRLLSSLLVNLFGAADLKENEIVSTEEFRRIVPDVDRDEWGAWAREEARAELRQREVGDTRDCATPADMAALLIKIWNEEILTAEGSRLLKDILYRCITGAGRLKGMLPPRSRVAHKTGTLLYSTNDVGIVDLPDGAGNLVAVVFSKNSYETTGQRRDALIAHLSRAAYDYFTFVSSPIP